MLTTSLSHLALLLLCYVAPIVSEETEITPGRLKPTCADCRAAIAHCPDGTVRPDGKIPDLGQSLKFATIFRYDSCKVIAGSPFLEHASVADASQPPLRRPVIVNAATAIHLGQLARREKKGLKHLKGVYAG